MRIHLIQDLPTPHNIDLIDEVNKFSNVSVIEYYSVIEDKTRYQWDKLLREPGDIEFLYGLKLNVRFISKMWRLAKTENVIIVGWMNVNTLFLHLILLLTFRRFIHWTDLPSDAKLLRETKRRFMYFLMFINQTRIFCAGTKALDYFKNIGLRTDQLVNIPISTNIYFKHGQHSEYLSKQVRIVAGSRLIYDKGYDILLEALNILKRNGFDNFHLDLIGSGVERANLESFVTDNKMTDLVKFHPWMGFDEFMSLISESFAFIHPARFDAFGGSIFGMACGVPVIGSSGAGAVKERVVHGMNGLIYDDNNPDTLANLIHELVNDPVLYEKLRIGARRTAKQWTPQVVAKKVIESLF